MQCPNCSAQNPDDAAFCSNCNARLRLVCLRCRAELPAHAHFCLNCGQPTRAASAFQAASFEAERRSVTILFADISGFTAMVDSSGPEEVRSFINGCFDRLVPIVEKYGGAVDKFIGDEIMALFGAPTAHEDDPARALRAALEMMDELQAYNAERGAQLGLHVGVNTGMCVAGGIGSQGRQHYSVIGSAVNLAARMQDASQTGEILVGPDTYRLTAPLFEFEPLAPIQFKGKAEPVQPYRLLGLKAQPGRLRGLSGLTSPMVGRNAELAALLQLSQSASNGRGGVAVVIGEAGLGKSRLIAEWRAACAGLPLQWAQGQCLSYGQGLAYHLLIDTLHAIVGVPAAAAEAEMRAALRSLIEQLFGEAALNVYPYLGHLLSLHLEPDALERVRLLDPQSLQAQYLSALRQLLKALAVRAPLVLLFEDIHWADPSSVELLLKLMPLTAETALVFCFVARPDRDAPGWKLAAGARDLAGDRLVELTLQTLSEDDSRQLISNLLEIEALPEPIRAVILRKAEGNPFFVEEVIRMLIDRGAITREGNRWAAQKQVELVEIPDNLQGLLMARIDRLPDDVKHTLRVASVIGRQFSVRVLDQVLRGVE